MLRPLDPDADEADADRLDRLRAARRRLARGRFPGRPPRPAQRHRGPEAGPSLRKSLLPLFVSMGRVPGFEGCVSVIYDVARPWPPVACLSGSRAARVLPSRMSVLAAASGGRFEIGGAARPPRRPGYRASVGIAADDLATVGRAQGPPGEEVDRVLEELDAAVAHRRR